MAKKLTSLSWEDMQREMSIAGRPEKISELGFRIMKQVEQTTDFNNAAEISNVDFALRRVRAELKLRLKMLEQKTGQTK